jgi:tRNA pseudouridine55 synthase
VPLSGLLVLNKPKGLTSHDVVARVRRLSGQAKAGHTGTLDPMATGVLLVCLGQATRLIEYVQSGRKQYRATIRFGRSTDTLDADGQTIRVCDPTGLTAEQLQQQLTSFQGEIDQIPPLFSALKKGGQPLYKLARAGEMVELSPRRVTIDSISWVEWQPPDLTLDIVCSAGTYIRALARDLGEAVETGAHLVALSRTANGQWGLNEAIGLAELEAVAQNEGQGWQRFLQPLAAMVAHLPQVTLSPDQLGQVRHGRPVSLAGANWVEPVSDIVATFTPTGNFLAILTRVASDDKLWQPKKVFLPGG